MSESPIRFRKQRELGDIITDTFRFLRENYKLLFKLIFRITGPVFLIVLLALAYYSYLSLDTVENPLLSWESGNFTLIFSSFFILMSSLLAFYVLLNGTILHFIRSYINNEGQVQEREVFEGMKQDFGGLLGLLLLGTIIVGFGTLLCVLPGIFLWVPISITPAVMVFGRRSIMDSITEAFGLVRDNWWATFFTLFIMVILVYIISLVFQFPMIIYFFFKGLTSFQEGSVADPSSMFDWVYVVLNVISSLFQYLLSSIVIIATAFIYYHLDEKKNLTGSYQVISNLGSEIKG